MKKDDVIATLVMFFVFWPWIIAMIDLFSMCVFGNTVSYINYSEGDSAAQLAMVWPVACFCIVMLFNL